MQISGGPPASADSGTPSLGAFLAELASGSPAPGGGAAAALAGALAAALVAMACRVTAARDRSETSVASRSIAAAEQLRETLARLVVEDAEAYRGVVRSRSQAPGSATTVDALRRATEVPLSLCRHSRDVLALCEAVVPRARESTISDLGVAAALAWGALEAGALTARANLKALRDGEFVRRSEGELGAVLSQGAQARERVTRAVAERMG
jgi:methenyltetrahydrofolate cyclohydrolase